MRGKTFIISGPSGVGKSTVLKSLLGNREDIYFSVSATTRSPREGEVNGVHYHFIDADTFREWIAKDEFLEYAEYVGNFYGTPKTYVERLLNEGKNVLLEIEVNGAQQVVEKIPDAITIFLMPPSLDELERRIRGRRTESEEIVQERLAKAAREMKLQDRYKHVVFNDDLETASLEIAKIIRSYM